VNDEGSTPFFLDLVAQVESFVAAAEMSHGDMHTVISEHPRGHHAKTATRTGNEGNAIMQIHNEASCELPTFHQRPLLPNARDQRRVAKPPVRRSRESALLFSIQFSALSLISAVSPFTSTLVPKGFEASARRWSI